MEQSFQTSFIPKKPMVEKPEVISSRVSFFTLISLFLFFAVGLATGVVYFYEKTLEKKIKLMDANLTLAKNRFEPEKIVQLQSLDKRLQASTDILSQHVSVLPVFKALSQITEKNIRYTKFNYEYSNDKIKSINVKLSGVATGYKAIALQSNLFSQNKYFIDTSFSNLSLDDKGNVVFDLQFKVDPNFVDYRQNIKTNSENLDITSNPVLN